MTQSRERIDLLCQLSPGDIIDCNKWFGDRVLYREYHGLPKYSLYSQVFSLRKPDFTLIVARVESQDPGFVDRFQLWFCLLSPELGLMWVRDDVRTIHGSSKTQ